MKLKARLKNIKVLICQFFIDFGERRMLKSKKHSQFWSNFCWFWVKF